MRWFHGVGGCGRAVTCLPGGHKSCWHRLRACLVMLWFRGGLSSTPGPALPTSSRTWVWSTRHATTTWRWRPSRIVSSTSRSHRRALPGICSPLSRRWHSRIWLVRPGLDPWRLPSVPAMDTGVLRVIDSAGGWGCHFCAVPAVASASFGFSFLPRLCSYELQHPERL